MGIGQTSCNLFCNFGVIFAPAWVVKDQLTNHTIDLSKKKSKMKLVLLIPQSQHLPLLFMILKLVLLQFSKF